jgi:hypothetical protein
MQTPLLVTEITQRFAAGLTDPVGLVNFTTTFQSNETNVIVTGGVLCTKKSGAKDSYTSQLLIHGSPLVAHWHLAVDTDSSYWNFMGKGMPMNNSYVVSS